MYRITRVIPKNNIYDVLSLDCVSKVEIKQGKNNFRNPKICRVNIYIIFPTNDSRFFKNSVTFSILGVLVIKIIMLLLLVLWH